jgi:predicted O-methyltransferase YrrM
MKFPSLLKHASKFGVITLRYRTRSRTLTYEQKGGQQTAVDHYGVSLDDYIHALYDFTFQSRAKKVLMIGCAGGTLGTMLTRGGKRVTMVDIDKIAFKLAKRYFGLPRGVRCHVSDGLTFLQKTRERYDALIVDAFIGESIPTHMKSAAFFAAARRAVRKNGVALVNVCLERKKDPTADKIAVGFRAAGWSVRLLDSPGVERNAIVLAGKVKGLRRPKLLMSPDVGADRLRKEVKAMRFRRTRAAPQLSRV